MIEKAPHKRWADCLYAHIRADANVKGKLVELCAEVRTRPRNHPRVYKCTQGIVVQEFNPCNDQPGVILFSCGETRRFWESPDTRHVWLRPIDDKGEKVSQ